MKKIILLILFYVATCNLALGQQQYPNPIRPDSARIGMLNMPLSSGIEIPSHKESILPPEMEFMNMYSNYPVNLSTGLVDISIPLYEIKTPGLSLPIHAKFHPSGLKADEQEGVMGLRWLLDANYSINRKIKGYPDDDYTNNGTHFPFDNRVNTPGYEPDLASIYGTVFKPWRNTDLAISQNILQHLSEYQGPPSKYMDTQYDIFSYHLPSGKSGKFILKDSAGIKIPHTLPYEPIRIEIQDNHSTRPGRFYQITITDEDGISYNYGRTLHLPTAKHNIEVTQCDENQAVIGWYLNAIISANKKDSILFDYQYVPKINRPVVSYTYHINDNFDYNESIGSSSDMTMYDLVGGEFSHTPDIKHIDHYCNGQEVMNNLSSITFNGGKITFQYSYSCNKYLMSSMIISNTNNLPTRRINFTYRKEGTLVLLDKLSFADVNSLQAKETYTFEYFNNSVYPSNNEVQADWWGYYLSSGRNVVYEDNIRAIVPNGNTSIEKYMTIGTANNKTSNLASMRTGMIKSIQYPTGGKTVYDYESNYFENRNNGWQKEACGGLRIKSVENIAANGASELKTYIYNPQKNGCGNMPEHLLPPLLSNGKDRNFFTETVTDVHYRTSMNSGNGSYCSRSFSNILPGQFMDFHSNIVTYDKVVEYQGTQNSNAGYTEYTYSYLQPIQTQYNHQVWKFKHSSPNKDRQFIHILPPRFGEDTWLEKKSVFNTNGQLQEETQYNYTPFRKGSLYDLPVTRYVFNTVGDDYHQGSKDDMDTMDVDQNMLAYFGYINQEYTLGATRLTKETVRTYTPQGTVTTVKDIEFDLKHLLPVKETHSTSIDNETRSITYKYPYQYSSEPYTGMTRRNMLRPVIETGIYKNGNLLEKGTTPYRQWFTDVYAPANFQYQKTGNDAETRLEYQYNNHGRLSATVKDGAQRVVYIRNAYAQPMAVIDQAGYSEVETALGAAFINRIAQKYAPDDDDLTTLNGLRNRLPNAHITTYKYKPLVGISEITDPSGLTTYYDYDNLGRLKEIYIRKGTAKEVLESYNYNYVNQ